jgi:flagellum-specific ATP synthase
MIARNTEADVIVIALVAERRREVQEFIERDLGEEGLKKAVVIVATADDPPLARVRSIFTATAIAEYFRDQDKNVLLIVDSVTRVAMAQREIGATLGEIPVSRGYSPSVFTMLPKILERAGTSERGTITGIYNVLVEGADLDEPISDAIRGILDGHIVLSRALAAKNHYPPIDVPESVSRLMMYISEKDHLAAASQIKEWLAAFKEVEDLINIGAYVKGANPTVDQAILRMPEIKKYLKQGVGEVTTLEDSVNLLMSLGLGRTRSSLRSPNATPLRGGVA